MHRLSPRASVLLGYWLIRVSCQQSCDFCYRRKIKCDGQKPRCSTCVTYMIECTQVAPKRQSHTKQQRIHGRLHQGVRTTEARFADLETQLEHLTALLIASPIRHDVQTQPQSPVPGLIDTPTTIATREGQEAAELDSTNVPPLHHVRPLVEVFLIKYNSVLPLFHPQSLLHLVDEFYSVGSKRRDPVAWAAINVVLALTHRYALQGATDSTASTNYLSRAQSVVSAVIEAETKLLNIQVLLGMVILLQGSPDQQPPLILIAITFRLAHKIGLHTRASSVVLEPVLARQRALVFWIAYIFDKDLSMRQQQPSIQRDDDIDHILPLAEVDSFQSGSTGIHSGQITTADGAVTMNYFLARIQLAVIEGGVYDYLYSTRSQKRTPDDRAKALDSVACALEQWKASVPPEFSAATASQTVPPDLLPFISFLHSTSFMCAALINQAHAWNAKWVSSLQSNARLGTAPSVPPLWDLLVDEARSLVTLIQALPPSDSSNFW